MPNYLNQEHQLTPQQAQSFFGVPEKQLLRPGTELYRIIEMGRSAPLGQYWFYRHTYERMLEQFHGLGPNRGPNLRQAEENETARNQNRSAQSVGETNYGDVARTRLAVSRNWNAMTHLVVFVLQKPVYAWIGKVRPQPYVSGGENNPLPNVYLIGGAQQIFLPNLVEKDAQGNWRKESDHGRVFLIAPLPMPR